MDWGDRGSATTGMRTSGGHPDGDLPPPTPPPPPPMPGHYQVGLFGTEQEQGEHAAADEHAAGTSNAGGHSVVLCQTYYRCRAACDVSFSDKAVETSGTNLGFITGGEQRRIGALDGQGTAINLCFVGSRIMRGQIEANQNISLTFDPATLTCIACESKHRILASDSPICVCVTDQNFPANLSGNGNCVTIVRLESASLSELCDLCSELFELSPLVQ